MADALFETSALSRWAVEVSEVKILAARAGVDWWLLFRRGFDTSRNATACARIRVVSSAIGGDVVRVACDSRADADSLIDAMTSNGIPHTAVRAVRETQTTERTETR